MTSPPVTDLLAAYRLASQETTRDRRALIALALAETLGSQSAAGQQLREDGQAGDRRTVSDLCIRARAVRADPTRLDAALALGGPIPTPTPEETR